MKKIVHFKIQKDKLVVIFDNAYMDTEKSNEAAPLLDKELEQNQDAKAVIFDLKAVDYISSAFLRICVSSAKKVGQKNFKIINTKPVVNKVFKISGLEQQFDIK